MIVMTDEEREEYYETCYECTGYGDDYTIDEDGEMVCRCTDCWVMERLLEDDD